MQKTIIITGGSKGIGREAALRFAHQGHQLVLVGRNKDALSRTVQDCQELGSNTIGVQADMSKEDEVEKIAQQAIKYFNGFDVWINNASLFYYGSFETMASKDFKQIIETNLFGYVYGCQAALKQFRKQGAGTIINVASSYGLFPAPQASAYVASKFAVRGLSASIRQELKLEPSNQIHIGTIMPATIDTTIYQTAANKTGTAIVAPQPVYPASMVVDAMQQMLDKPKDEITVGYAAKYAAYTYQLWPWLGERVVSKYIMKFNFIDKPANISDGSLYTPSGNSVVSGKWPTWQQAAIKRAGLATVSLVAIGLLIKKYKK